MTLAKSFSVVWTDLTVDLNDSGFTSSLVFDLENGSPFQVSSIPGADFFVQLNGLSICRVIVQQLSLVKGYQSLKLDVNVLFLDPNIERDALVKALEKASLQYAQENNFVLSIIGPVLMPNAGFIHKVTEQLRFDVSLKDLLDLNLGKDIIMSDLLSLSGVESILGNSTIALQVASDTITIPFGLALPNLAPIPRKFNFGYTTSINIVGSNVEIMQIVVDPVSISRSNMGISVNSSVSIHPENNDAAASDLARAVNPILALHPSPGI